MRFDFSGLDVADRTTRYYMHRIQVGGMTPYLVVRPATEATKGYYNEVLKRVGKSARSANAGQLTPALVRDIRDDERRLYPRHIIVDWGYLDGEKDVPGVMLDADGKPVKFALEACTAFLDALPGWLFDDLRGFCGKNDNFVEEGEEPVDGVVAGQN